MVLNIYVQEEVVAPRVEVQEDPAPVPPVTLKQLEGSSLRSSPSSVLYVPNQTWSDDEEDKSGVEEMEVCAVPQGSS